MNLKNLIFSLAVFFTLTTRAQFSGSVGSADCDAIFKDSSIIVSWATTCTVVRGRENCTDLSSSLASFGFPADAVGIADNSPVSLGDAGSAILTFQFPITNASGPDFAIFENSFSSTFLELAFVEVSSNGIDYVRFPAVSNTQSLVQIGPFDNQGDAAKLQNLAGKHAANYGTPFDLQVLIDSTIVNINAITHVKIIDVVGQISGAYSSKDKNQNPINDPFPTQFPTSGFDLDAIAVLNESSAQLEHQMINHFYMKDGFLVAISQPFVLFNTCGQVISSEVKQLEINTLPVGIYYARNQQGVSYKICR
jgi:hypothetical protein